MEPGVGAGAGGTRFWALGVWKLPGVPIKAALRARTGVQPRTDSVPLPSEGDLLPFPFSKAPCGEQRLISCKGQGRPNGAQVGFPELWILVAAFPWPFSQEGTPDLQGSALDPPRRPGFSEKWDLGTARGQVGSTLLHLGGRGGQGRAASPLGLLVDKEYRLSLQPGASLPAQGAGEGRGLSQALRCLATCARPP